MPNVLDCPYTPEYLKKDFPAPKRMEIYKAYRARVYAAMKMIIAGELHSEVMKAHGRFVYQDAMKEWRKVWESMKFDSEGKAYKN